MIASGPPPLLALLEVSFPFGFSEVMFSVYREADTSTASLMPRSQKLDSTGSDKDDPSKLLGVVDLAGKI